MCGPSAASEKSFATHQVCGKKREKVKRKTQAGRVAVKLKNIQTMDGKIEKKVGHTRDGR